MVVAKKNPVIISCGFHTVFEKTQKLWLTMGFFPEKMVVVYIEVFQQSKKLVA